MKIIIIGGSHGGHESALELAGLYPDAEITLYDENEFIAFMSCGMELYLKGETTGIDQVRNFKPTDLEAHGVTVKTQTRVTDIDSKQHQISFTNLADGTTQTADYDKLILSSGVTPARTDVPGSQLDNIYLMRGQNWAAKINEKLHDDQVKTVGIIGGGYIGLEAADVFAHAGKRVSIFEPQTRLLAKYLDQEIYDVMADRLADKLEIHTQEKLTEYRG